MYGLERSDFADAIVRRDVVYRHAASLRKSEVSVLLNALEGAILGAEVESCGPVIAETSSVYVHAIWFFLLA
jgi:hypothetical protein